MFHGKVYKIVNNIDDSVYIGSTINSLHLRFAVHTLTAKYTKYKNGLLYKKINELGVEHFRIELLDEITCDDKKDLKTLEGKYILQYGTLNVRMAGRSIQDSKKVYNERHKDERRIASLNYYYQNKDQPKDKAKDEMKQYYLDNKEKIKQQMKQNYIKRKERTNNNKMLINNI